MFVKGCLREVLTAKEQLHLYRPKITFGPLKATARLMWPPVKMSENCSKHGFADHIEIRLGKDNSIFHIVFLIVFFH